MEKERSRLPSPSQQCNLIWKGEMHSFSDELFSISNSRGALHAIAIMEIKFLIIEKSCISVARTAAGQSETFSRSWLHNWGKLNSWWFHVRISSPHRSWFDGKIQFFWQKASVSSASGPNVIRQLDTLTKMWEIPRDDENFCAQLTPLHFRQKRQERVNNGSIKMNFSWIGFALDGWRQRPLEHKTISLRIVMNLRPVLWDLQGKRVRARGSIFASCRAIKWHFRSSKKLSDSC